AAHGLAEARDIQDTSRQGRWHNKRFAKLAVELGMSTTKDPKLGYPPCTLTDPTTIAYQGVITGIGDALGAWRHPELGIDGKPRTTNGLACQCECPRKLRISQTVFDAGPIVCPLCTESFLPNDVDRSEYNTAYAALLNPATSGHTGTPGPRPANHDH